MPQDIIYTKKADAEEYASEVGGFVVSHDANGDGAPDSFKVLIEESTRGPNPGELIPENPTLGDFRRAGDQAKYLKGLSEASKPRNMGGVVVDELGYMHGGMNFNKRGPVKYSKGGAVKGKKFAGSF